MSRQAATKGDALEGAVRRIKEACLNSDPQIRGREFTIESKVRDTSSGVLHEIDLLVRTCPGSEYEASFIYECKNWKKPVGKNEVLVLAAKVEALRANHGFLVAKSLSKYAKKQLELDLRVSFIRCTDNFSRPFNSIRLTHFIHDILPPSIIITWRVADSANPTNLDLKTLKCSLNGKPIEFLTFIDSQIYDLAEEVRKDNLHKLKNEGTHWFKTGREILFSPNEFMIAGIDVASIGIPFACFVTSRRLKLLSKFELEGQGQSYTFESIDTGNQGKPLPVHVVTTFKNPKSP